MPYPYDPEVSGTVTAACSAASAALCQRALAHQGAAKPTITLGSTATVESVLFTRFYAEAVEQTLKRFPWPFARAYATIEDVVGSEDAYASADHVYAFRSPSDCIHVRRIVRDLVGRKADRNPPPFVMGTIETSEIVHPAIAAWSDLVEYQLGDVVTGFFYAIRPSRNKPTSNPTYWTGVSAHNIATQYSPGDLVSQGGVVYDCLEANTNRVPPNATYWQVATEGWTNTISDGRRVILTNHRDDDTTDDEPALTVEYTKVHPCVALVGDALFRRALEFYLAGLVAPSLTRAKLTRAECFQLFELVIKEAEANAMQEQQEEVGDQGEVQAPWIDARG